MKFHISALAALISIVWLTPTDAEAQNRNSRGYRTAEGKKQYRYYGRRPSVSHTGDCQRDTGTQTSRLSTRSRCDMEEFWARQQRGRR